MDKDDVLQLDRQTIGLPLSHKKKNEIMPFAVAWMDLEIIIVSKVSHTKKDKYRMI